MLTINFDKVQEALDALHNVERNLNELEYYKKSLNNANHSTSLCSSVRSAISKLSNQHAALLQSLAIYGHAPQQRDAQLAAAQNPEYSANNIPREFTYTPAPEHKKGFWEKTINQIVLGDYSDDVTWLGTGVNLVLAFFGLDAPMDARDLTANVQKGEFGWAVVNFLSLAPVLGVLCKGGKTIDTIATGLKAGSKAAETTTIVLKTGSDMIDAGGTLSKTFENSADLLKHAEVLAQTKTTGKIYLHSSDALMRVEKNGKVFITTNVELVTNYNYVLKDAEEWKNFRYAFDGTSMKVDEARAMFDSLSDNDLKKLGYNDEAINVIRQGGTPEPVRSTFVKSLAEDENVVNAIKDYLTQMELSPERIEEGINGLKQGELPKNVELQVHHKYPLQDGGDNSLDNFILVDKYSHSIYTGYQNTATSGIIDSAIIDWPVPKGNISLFEFSEDQIADIETQIQALLNK